MARLVSALDETTSKQCGENGHVEYSWSGDFNEKVLQLSFQLTRVKDKNKKLELCKKYRDLLREAFNCSSLYSSLDDSNLIGIELKESIGFKKISLLFRLMLQTRDIVKGKGEYGLFYLLLGEWVLLGDSSLNKNKNIINNLVNLAIKSTVNLTIDEKEEHGYGSWKDMKYFLNYMRDELGIPYKKLEQISAFKYIIKLISRQLYIDNILMNTKGGNISLLGRWVPREKSKKFGWIAKYISKDLYSKWIHDKSLDSQKHNLSVRKALTHYRKMIAKLNTELDTVQIKQCGKTWGDIDFNKSVTSLTLSKQKNAFNYMDSKGQNRGTDEDRLLCKENYMQYIKDCKSGKKEIKGARCSLVDLVKEAMQHCSRTPQHSNQEIIATINLQWKNLGEQIGDLGNMIAMVDTSGSMCCDDSQPLHAAIGLGCRIAEKSKLGRRVLTFSQKPEWVNLEKTSDLTSMVDVVKNSNWGMTTDFYSAMRMILDACIEKHLKPEEVSDMVLVIFSDMQINQADSTDSKTMSGMINKMFHDGGMKTIHKTPYKAPHILFWNLRSLNGFPALSTENNISMLSGFSGVLLNTFCEKGMEALENCTPMSILMEQLNDSRYIWVNERIEKYINENEEVEYPDTPNSVENISPRKVNSVEENTPIEPKGWFTGLW